jgi:hypothetical protein
VSDTEIPYLTNEQIIEHNAEIQKILDSVPGQVEQLRMQLAYNNGILSERKRLQDEQGQAYTPEPEVVTPAPEAITPDEVYTPSPAAAI